MLLLRCCACERKCGLEEEKQEVRRRDGDIYQNVQVYEGCWAEEGPCYEYSWACFGEKSEGKKNVKTLGE